MKFILWITLAIIMTMLVLADAWVAIGVIVLLSVVAVVAVWIINSCRRRYRRCSDCASVMLRVALVCPRCGTTQRTGGKDARTSE